MERPERDREQNETERAKEAAAGMHAPEHEGQRGPEQ